MQQLSRSFHGAFTDMGTHDISIFQITANFNFEQILFCNLGEGAARAARHRDRHLAGGGGVRVSGGLRARRRVLRRLLVRRLGGE